MNGQISFTCLEPDRHLLTTLYVGISAHTEGYHGCLRLDAIISLICDGADLMVLVNLLESINLKYPKAFQIWVAFEDGHIQIFSLPEFSRAVRQKEIE